LRWFRRIGHRAVVDQLNATPLKHSQ
jgi:hypothetical protein